jgi:hypothetical protein
VDQASHPVGLMARAMHLAGFLLDFPQISLYHFELYEIQ